MMKGRPQPIVAVMHSRLLAPSGPSRGLDPETAAVPREPLTFLDAAGGAGDDGVLNLHQGEP